MMDSAFKTLIENGGPWVIVCLFILVLLGWVIKQLGSIIVKNTEAFVEFNISNRELRKTMEKTNDRLCDTLKDLKDEIRRD